MFHPLAVRFFIQRLVVERNFAGGNPSEEVSDAGVAKPGQDAFGAFGFAEGSEQFLRRRLGLRTSLFNAEQHREVVPQRAAGASVLAIVLGFGAAARAVVVLGDARAIDTDGIVAMGKGSSGEHAVHAASRARPVRAHGNREAGPADPAFGPTGAVFAGHP
ncbi:hypothetical protein AB0O52_05745 [Arthrobacter sp. NPDC080073]|uniref:hypothetical protein n=1 Tax=Arthrobacter sp. NPDC080073 TaxID=3155919 RepID=UPI00343FC6C8